MRFFVILEVTKLPLSGKSIISHGMMTVFIVLIISQMFTGCVYTPITGKSEKRSVDKDYLSFWYSRQIVPAFVSYRNKTEELLQTASLMKGTNNEE